MGRLTASNGGAPAQAGAPRAPREVHQHALERRGAVRKCEACGQDKWIVSQNLFLLQALQPGGGVVPGQGVEVVPVFCNHCGLIRLHASTILVAD